MLDAPGPRAPAADGPTPGLGAEALTTADLLASDLPGRLPPGMRTPRVFRIDHLGGDRVALWLEYVNVADVAWDRARYARAARLLAR